MRLARQNLYVEKFGGLTAQDCILHKTKTDVSILCICIQYIIFTFFYCIFHCCYGYDQSGISTTYWGS